MSIDKFTETFRNPARANRFKIDMVLPSFVNVGSASQDISTLCKSTSLPKSELGIVEAKHQGRTFPYPGDRTFAEFTLTFYLEEDMKLRNIFQAWNNAINRFQTNTSGASISDIKKDFTLSQLSYSNFSVLKTYKFIKAFPYMISEVPLDMDSENSISTFDVSFRYDRFSDDASTS